MSEVESVVDPIACVRAICDLMAAEYDELCIDVVGLQLGICDVLPKVKQVARSRGMQVFCLNIGAMKKEEKQSGRGFSIDAAVLAAAGPGSGNQKIVRSGALLV